MGAIDLSIGDGSDESRLPGEEGDHSGLDVQLLGSVRLFLDGRSMPLSGHRPRRLLALLALHANELVPTGRIEEALWADTLPDSARQQVYNVVAIVRRSLGDYAGIEKTGSGYQLTLSDRHIDAIRFQRGVKRAERAAAQGNFAQAADLFESALGEWRGPALADLEGEIFQNAATLLHEQRLTALEDLSGSLLRVGDPVGAARRLTPLVVEHPFRESLRALLMKSLYRAGRQAEALAVFEDGRRLLSEELGVGPGAALQAAHQEVLSGEAEPSPRAFGPGRPASGTGRDLSGTRRAPCQLPMDARLLIGRERELAELIALAQETDAPGGRGSMIVSAIDGMGGVGKSALAVHAAHILRERFPDGQLYVDLHGHTPGMTPVEPVDALGHFLQALGVAPQQVPDDVDMRASCFRDCLADTRTLVVLDNAASTAQVEALLPGTAGCMVLVTSRRRLAGLRDGHQISLDTLPEKIAVDLLRRAAEPTSIRDDYEAASDLVGLCGYLPLAIRIVAARLKHNTALTARSLVMELREEDGRIGRLSDGEREIEGVFDASLKVLPSQGQRLYRLLGLVPGPDFDAYSAASLLGTDLRTAERTLQLLFDHNLLLQSAAGRYSFHDLLHAHARGLSATDAESGESLDSLLDYYLRTAWAANQHLAMRQGPSRSGDAEIDRPAPELLNQDQAVAWLRAEQSNLLAALSLPQLSPARMTSLIQALSSHLIYDGMWSLAIDLHRREIRIAQDGGDRLAEANALLESAAVLERLGRHDTAVEDASCALVVYRELGNRLGEAHAMAALGQVAYVRSRLVESFALSENALEVYEEVGDRRGAAKSSWRLGCILSFQGENTLAADRVLHAIMTYRELGDGREESNCLVAYSRVLYALHDFAEVRPALERALLLGRRCDFRLCVANALQEMATYRARAGEYAEATESLEEALQINRDLGFPLGEGYDYLILGRISFATGDLYGALRLQTRAITLFREIEAIYEASALDGMARVHHARGDLEQAAQSLDSALALVEGARVTHMELQAEVRNTVAVLKFDTEGPEAALAEHRLAMGLAIEGGVPHEQARALEGIARCESQLGQIQPGLDHLREALDLYKRMGAMEYRLLSSRS